MLFSCLYRTPIEFPPSFATSPNLLKSIRFPLLPSFFSSSLHSTISPFSPVFATSIFCRYSLIPFGLPSVHSSFTPPSFPPSSFTPSAFPPSSFTPSSFTPSSFSQSFLQSVFPSTLALILRSIPPFITPSSRPSLSIFIDSIFSCWILSLQCICACQSSSPYVCLYMYVSLCLSCFMWQDVCVLSKERKSRQGLGMFLSH